MNDKLNSNQFPAWIAGNWFLLSLPAIVMLGYDASTSERVDFIRISGLICTWILLLSLAVTPLLRVLPAGNFRKYLRKNRRYLGVAAFFYTLLHLAYYFKEVRDIGKILKTFVRFEMLTGWISLFIMVALAVTSFDSSVQKMGPAWKKLHLWAYPAAALAFVHWAMAGNKIIEPLIYFVPLLALRFVARRR